MPPLASSHILITEKEKQQFSHRQDATFSHFNPHLRVPRILSGELSGEQKVRALVASGFNQSPSSSRPLKDGGISTSQYLKESPAASKECRWEPPLNVLVKLKL